MTSSNNRATEKENIWDLVREAGIVGAGGAGFPTHVKLSCEAHVVIANGAECEPLLETDRHLMLREGKKIVEGLNLALKAVGAKEGIIAVKAKHGDIISTFESLLKDQRNIRLHLLDNFYPAGDEHVLVYETTKKLVPMGGIPINAGAVVLNVYTLSLISDAYAGKPFTHRYVTVTGEVKRPAVAKLPIGMTIREAIDKLGCGPRIDDYAVVVGGPMMGKLEENLDTPIQKTTGGIIVLPKDHTLVQQKDIPLSIAAKRAKSVCCQCNFCTQLCPRYLLGHHLKPHNMMRSLSWDMDSINIGSIYSSSLCSECGVCGYFACTMGLQPNKVNSFYKGILARNKTGRISWADKDQQIDEFRELRKIPTNRLIGRLGLDGYNVHLPFIDEQFSSNRLILPLKQHAGQPSEPIVKAGDRVAMGDKLATVPEGSLGANLHSPMDGTVVRIDQNIVIEND
ncbi:MAG: 4Fe-4S dicluster domain-containing protein [Mahellales bacterium]|jgi:Na+-translocating ferredoxin:NAD+ oxidoreductase RnfC subunit